VASAREGSPSELGSAAPVGGGVRPRQAHPNHIEGEIEMNSINITGRLARDPELRSLPNGGSVCKLRLAVEGLASGNETAYINASCFGAGGQAAARVLSKGWLVAVSGRLAYDEWETAGGAKRHDYEVVGRVEFLAAPKGQASEAPAPEPVAIH
jgi:single-strand DNA-binding protein